MIGRGAVRDVARRALGAVLVLAGTGHLVTHREEFRAQVPSWVPLADDVVVEVFGSGAVGADVVGVPAAAEFVAAGGQFADELV